MAFKREKKYYFITRFPWGLDTNINTEFQLVS